MRCVLLAVLILAKACCGAEASCIDPATLVSSTVNISREFGEEERKDSPGVFGIRGTGWFLTPRLMVTAAHVSDAMHLSAQEWKEIRGAKNRCGHASCSWQALSRLPMPRGWRCSSSPPR
jgi:hypothetical protein